MSSFLKGNYNIDAVINDDKKRKKNEFREKALNSIGGSMVFVERKKMTWNGSDEGINDDGVTGKK